jgi:hypothetical protein
MEDGSDDKLTRTTFLHPEHLGFYLRRGRLMLHDDARAAYYSLPSFCHGPEDSLMHHLSQWESENLRYGKPTGSTRNEIDAPTDMPFMQQSSWQPKRHALPPGRYSDIADIRQAGAMEPARLNLAYVEANQPLGGSFMRYSGRNGIMDMAKARKMADRHGGDAQVLRYPVSVRPRRSVPIPPGPDGTPIDPNPTLVEEVYTRGSRVVRMKDKKDWFTEMAGSNSVALGNNRAFERVGQAVALQAGSSSSPHSSYSPVQSMGGMASLGASGRMG